MTFDSFEIFVVAVFSFVLGLFIDNVFKRKGG
jgi:hypothetical protein